ncbi:MAG TPA: ABC-2 family transporter protein [Pilimelia sp.]|nr:ABC-2 family transporter protein [Pilimelia sp.]
MNSVAATASQRAREIVVEQITTFGTLVGSGFRRYATYRQATVASAATNTMFGFLRTYVLLAVTAGTGVAAGYSEPQLASFVWVGQGLIGVVGFWGWTDLADRIRTGEVVVDLIRPIRPVTAYLMADLGRAGHGLLTRFVIPVAAGAIAFDLYVPRHPASYALFPVAVGLSVVVSFGCRFLVNTTGYWLLDIRGVLLLWAVISGVLSGLTFPVRFLPDWLADLLWYATPFPSILQTPLDIAVERVPPHAQLGLVAVQAAWAIGLLAACALVQHRAERRLVIQGG